MKYPIALCSINRLLIIDESFFRNISTFSKQGEPLTINANKNCPNALKWAIDSEGLYYDFIWQSAVKPNIFQKLGLFAQKERYNISNPRRITVTELKGKIVHLNEPYPEITNIADLITILDTKVPDSEIDPNDMKTYFGI